MSVEKIQDGVVVSLAYKLTVDGETLEEATTDDPLEYLHGANDLLPSLEARLAGKRVGDKLCVTLEPEEGYGEYDPDATEVLGRDSLPDEVEEGMELMLEDNEGNLFEAVVKEITKDTVVLDFNSPLAGKTVTYDVEVVGLRRADEAELAHGHVHEHE